MTAGSSGRSLGWGRTLSAAVLVAVAGVFLTALVAATGTEKLGYDFRAVYFPAAEAVRDGMSPYVIGADAAKTGALPYVYPPQLAVALVPFTALSTDAAAFLAFLGCLAALFAALALVGLRDIRCYAAILVWAPGWNALEMANVTALLALALALMWRWRAKELPLGAALGLAISTKLFLWPMFVWAVAFRRLQAAAVAVVVGTAVTITAWAAIGFAGLRSYPDQLDLIVYGDSYSFVAMSIEFGFGRRTGDVVSAIVGIALLALMVRFARRGDEIAAFTCATAAAIAFSPVVWQHYLVLLAVPLALARPRFSAIWLLPIVLWLSPRAGNGDGPETILPALVAAILLVALLARPRTWPATAEAT